MHRIFIKYNLKKIFIKIKNFFGKKNKIDIFFKLKIISKKIFVENNWKEVIFFEKVKIFIKIIIFLLFILLLINPSFWISEQDKKNISYEIVFWIDNSLSMLAVDWKIDLKNYWKNSFEKNWENKNRLDRAKDKILEIINWINWNFWLLEFSWNSFISIPLTSDKNSFWIILKKIDVKNNSKNWTNFYWIIDNLWKIFNLKGWKEKILILLSDWENQSDNFIDLDFFKKNKIHVIAIWFWDKNWSKIILWKNNKKNNKKNNEKIFKLIYKQYEWKDVLSKLNEDFLKKIADKTWWKYFNEKDGFQEIINFIQNKFEKKIILEKEIKEKKYFQFFAFLIILFIILEIFLYKILKKNILLKIKI